MNSSAAERHRLVARPALGAVVLPAEGDAALVQREQAAVGDRHPVGVARQIGQHRRGPGKRALGIDHPLALRAAARASGRRRARRPARRARRRTAAGPLRCAWSSSSRKRRRNSRESTRTGRKKPGLQATQRSPSGDSPPPGTMPCTCGMMRQRRAPGVQHQRRADARAQMLRIGGDGAQRLGGDVEQQAVDHGLVLVGDGGDRRRQREDHVVVLHRQQIGLPRLEPAPRGAALALRAVPVAAGVVGDLDLLAAFAAQDMSTQRRAAALLDGRHDLELTQAQVTALRLPPGRPVGAEDVGDLQGGAPHGGGLRRRASVSSGLITSRSSSVATWV